jgi:integrase
LSCRSTRCSELRRGTDEDGGIDPPGDLSWREETFHLFFGCSPDRLCIEEVRAYQLHLAGLGWSWSHINQVSCALRFFFGVTLGRPEAFDRIISAKEPKKLPVVLSGEQIVRFLQAVPGLRNRAALTTAYGAGLRVCEVAALKVWRHRQQPHGHPGRARQGRQGPLRHAVAAPPAHPSGLLAIG